MLFADDLSKGELICKQDQKVMMEKGICPKFCKCADLKFQAQNSDRVECHLSIKIWEFFHLMKHLIQSWSVLRVAITSAKWGVHIYAKYANT